jgi:predicted metalloprotease
LIGGGIGLGGFLLLLVLSLVTGKNFFTLVGGGGDTQTSAPAQSGPIESTPEEEKLVDFVKFVLDDAQATWAKSFAASGRNYQDAVLVIFRNITDSGCGDAQSATGPFYCPLDQKVYIDLSFYDELKRRFGAPGDFAQAYVIAHELGHHVQHELGIDSEVRRAQESNPGAANRLSVALELQADCFAGVWGHSAEQRNELEAGDIEEGLSAASAVGDDRIQRATTGRVVPDSFTHGSAEQRASWFRRGFESGDLKDCDTFAQLR